MVNLNKPIKRPQTEAEIAAQEKLEKAKETLKKVKTQESKKYRRKRDTALFTLGAIFAHFHESKDPKEKEFAQKLWDQYYKKVAPDMKIMTDRRREALQDIYGLSVPKLENGAPHGHPGHPAANVDNSEV